MKIAYFSPVNPQKSGISDYSEALLPYLSKYAEIDVWVNGVKPTSKILNAYKIVDYVKNRNAKLKLKSYDAVVYNLGNNPEFHGDIYDVFLEHPGYVILHDLVLYYLITGYYLELKKDRVGYIRELYYNYDIGGIKAARQILGGANPPLQYQHPDRYPLIKTLLDKAPGIIVHSEYTRMAIVDMGYPPSKITKINHLIVNMDSVRGDKDKVTERIRDKYGIGSRDLLIASFGYIAPTKRNCEIINTINTISGHFEQPLKYLMVGEGNYVDRYLSDSIKKTGFLPIEEMEELLSVTDIVVNLRYPSMGETSGTLLRAMAIGKPCIVTDHAWFSELPDDIVIKIAHGVNEESVALTSALTGLIGDVSSRISIGKNAMGYVAIEHDPDKIAREMIAFIRRLPQADHSQEDYEDCVIKAYAERLNDLSVTDDRTGYITRISEKLLGILK